MSSSLPIPQKRKTVRKKVQPITPEIEQSMDAVAAKGYDTPEHNAPKAKPEQPDNNPPYDPAGTDYKNVSTSLNSHYRWLLSQVSEAKSREIGGSVSQRSIATGAVKRYLDEMGEQLGLTQSKASQDKATKSKSN